MKLSIDKSRNLSLDCVRIVAVLAIVMIHLSASYLNYGVSSPMFLWGNIFDGLSRVGVPLFVMVSGALMLDEKKRNFK
mgnify:CR=1 FL=1